eukprot:1160624-Pelagomonas_calceolata.AAC.14
MLSAMLHVHHVLSEMRLGHTSVAAGSTMHWMLMLELLENKLQKMDGTLPSHLLPFDTSSKPGIEAT